MTARSNVRDLLHQEPRALGLRRLSLTPDRPWVALPEFGCLKALFGRGLLPAWGLFASERHEEFAGQWIYLDEWSEREDGWTSRDTTSPISFGITLGFLFARIDQRKWQSMRRNAKEWFCSTSLEFPLPLRERARERGQMSWGTERVTVPSFLLDSPLPVRERGRLGWRTERLLQSQQITIPLLSVASETRETETQTKQAHHKVLKESVTDASRARDRWPEQSSSTSWRHELLLGPQPRSLGHGEALDQAPAEGSRRPVPLAVLGSLIEASASQASALPALDRPEEKATRAPARAFGEKNRDGNEPDRIDETPEQAQDEYRPDKRPLPGPLQHPKRSSGGRNCAFDAMSA